MCDTLQIWSVDLIRCCFCETFLMKSLSVLSPIQNPVQDNVLCHYNIFIRLQVYLKNTFYKIMLTYFNRAANLGQDRTQTNTLKRFQLLERYTSLSLNRQAYIMEPIFYKTTGKSQSNLRDFVLWLSRVNRENYLL